MKIRLMTSVLSFLAMEAAFVILNEFNKNSFFYVLGCNNDCLFSAIEVRRKFLETVGDSYGLKINTEDCVFKDRRNDWFLTDGENIIYSSVE